MLGTCYLEGIGVRKSKKQAIEWLELSANQDNEDAIELLDEIENDKAKEKTEDIQKIIWLIESYSRGNENAIQEFFFIGPFDIGKIRDEEYLTKQEKGRIYYWIAKAYENGYGMYPVKKMDAL